MSYIYSLQSLSVKRGGKGFDPRSYYGFCNSALHYFLFLMKEKKHPHKEVTSKIWCLHIMSSFVGLMLCTPQKRTWQRLVGLHAPYRDNEGMEAVTLAVCVELGQHDSVIGRLTHYRPTHIHIMFNSLFFFLFFTQDRVQTDRTWIVIYGKDLASLQPSAASDSSAWLIRVENNAAVLQPWSPRLSMLYIV